MIQKVAKEGSAKIGMEKLGAVIAVVAVLAVVVVLISTMMAAQGTASNPDRPSADARTSAIQSAKTNP